VVGYNGRTLEIDESISRSRDIGSHDRHFSTHTYFTLRVEDIFVAFSGAQLVIHGGKSRYGISLDSVVGYSKTAENLEIIEHFEQKTERLTTITDLTDKSA
jgi:hypothetical protein